MKKRTIVNIELRYAGASPSQIGWTNFRAFMDAFTRALKVMPGGTGPSEVMPVRVWDGCVAVSLDMPPNSMPGVQRLRTGPTRSWNTEMLRDTRPLYEWLGEMDAALVLLTAKGERPFKQVAPRKPPPNYRQFETLEGRVFRLGGRDGKVEIQFETEGTRDCDAGVDLAEQLAPYLYKPVRVECLVTRCGMTGDFESATIHAFTPIKQRLSAHEMLDGLRRTLGPEFTIDVDDFMKDIRE